MQIDAKKQTWFGRLDEEVKVIDVYDPFIDEVTDQHRLMASAMWKRVLSSQFLCWSINTVEFNTFKKE